MTQKQSVDVLRRSALLGSAGAAALAALGLAVGAAAGGAKGEVDTHIELVAEPAQVQISAGSPTKVWRYRGKLLPGAVRQPTYELATPTHNHNIPRVHSSP